MLCPKCATENPDDSGFCKDCGTQLTTGAPTEAQAPSSVHNVPIAAGDNTSGQGEGAYAPPEAAGWTFAGFVPYGIFAFKHGLLAWGIIGVLMIIPWLGIVLWVVYGIYIGINGKKLAWQHRRFDSLQQFQDTMKEWNRIGLSLLIIVVAGLGLLTILMLYVMAQGVY